MSLEVDMPTTILPDMAKRGRKPKHEITEGEERSGVTINIRIDPTVRKALDDFISAQRLPSTLTDAVELALTEFLKAEGFWPPKSKRNGHKSTDADSE